MTTTPTTEPSSITPGDTLKFERTLPDYPASAGWTIAYELVNSAARIAFSSTASGDAHAINVSAATTAAYTSGTYAWRARVSNTGGEVHTVGSGTVTVEKSFAAAADGRSQARRMLEAVESMLEGRASSATEMYEIQTPGGGMRKLKYLPIPDLLKLRDRLRQDVAREDAATRAAAGLQNPGRIQVRFQ